MGWRRRLRNLTLGLLSTCTTLVVLHALTASLVLWSIGRSVQGSLPLTLAAVVACTVIGLTFCLGPLGPLSLLLLRWLDTTRRREVRAAEGALVLASSILLVPLTFFLHTLVHASVGWIAHDPIFFALARSRLRTEARSESTSPTARRRGGALGH